MPPVPRAVFVGPDGDIYMADTWNQVIRKVDASGVITTVAGNGYGSELGDGGDALSARLRAPSGVAVDASGTMYVADTYNHRIRKIDGGGIITTYAGTGAPALVGDGGPAVDAVLMTAQAVATDSTGSLYIADSGGQAIKKVNDVGTLSAVAGSGTRGYSGDDGAATDADLNNPAAVAVDGSGNLYIADSNNHRIRKVDTQGIITAFAGNGQPGYSGDGGSALSASLNNPYGVAVDSRGNVFIADTFNHRIRKVNDQGIISTVAGNGSPGYSEMAGCPLGRAFRPSRCCLGLGGNLYIADTSNHRIRQVNDQGIISTVAGNGSPGYWEMGEMLSRPDFSHLTALHWMPRESCISRIPITSG